jgi:hypothetical protein
MQIFRRFPISLQQYYQLHKIIYSQNYGNVHTRVRLKMTTCRDALSWAGRIAACLVEHLVKNE